MTTRARRQRTLRRVLEGSDALDLGDLLLRLSTSADLVVPRAAVLAEWVLLYPDDDQPRDHPQPGRSGSIAQHRVFRALRDLEALRLIRRDEAVGPDGPTVAILNRAGLGALIAAAGC